MSAEERRTVHASHPAGEEIVRYNRAGKWYIELVSPSVDAPKRKQVTIAQAARRAEVLAEQGGEIHLRRPGGTSFDRLVRKPKRKGERE